MFTVYRLIHMTMNQFNIYEKAQTIWRTLGKVNNNFKGIIMEFRIPK